MHHKRHTYDKPKRISILFPNYDFPKKTSQPIYYIDVYNLLENIAPDVSNNISKSVASYLLSTLNYSCSETFRNAPVEN